MTIETKKQPRIEQEGCKWISWNDLEKVLEKIPSPLRDCVIMDLQGDAETGLIVKTGSQTIADTFLREVTKRVFGFSLRDLNPNEIREIKEIRKDLGITVEFNPSS